MLTGLWTIGIKVPDLERELEFHRQLGNEIVLDETLELDGEFFRVPLVKMGDKYLHLAEKMVYEDLLGKELPFGPTHLVYMTNDFEADLERAKASGSVPVREPAEVSAGFGDRRVGFFQAPSGWIFEIIEITVNRVPEV